MNHVLLVGSVKEKPVIKESASKVKYATLLVDVMRGFKNMDGEYEQDTICCLLWRSLAESVVSCCEKGTLVSVKARIQSEMRISTEGNTFYNYEIIAERVNVLEK